METPNQPYTDLGWANGWPTDKNGRTIYPARVQACLDSDHHTTTRDMGPPFRGLDNQVTCDICRIIWHYDSSD